MSLKDTLASIKEIKKKHKEKVLKKIYQRWEEKVYFKSPLWFKLWELFSFKNKEYIDMEEHQKVKYLNKLKEYEMTKSQLKIKKRVIEGDYTIHFPKFLYDKVYNENKRLNNRFLIIFYNNLLSVLKGGGNELKAIEKFYCSPYVKLHVKKIINVWMAKMSTGERNFVECLREHSKMFGEFEANIYAETAQSGISIEVLNNIIDNLKDMIQLDRAKKSIKRSLLFNFAILGVCYYYTFAFVITDIVGNLEGVTIPGDIMAMNNFGLWLKKPMGLITVIGIIVGLIFLGKKFKDNEFVSGILTAVPTLGDFVRFIELYSFTSALLLFYKYIECTDDKRISRAIKVVTNSFLRGFLAYKLEGVLTRSDRTEKFFADNKLFGDYSEYVTVEGEMTGKIEKLSKVLKDEKDAIMENLPEMLKNIVFIVLLFFVIILVALVTRIQIWMASPQSMGL